MNQKETERFNQFYLHQQKILKLQGKSKRTTDFYIFYSYNTSYRHKII